MPWLQEYNIRGMHIWSMAYHVNIKDHLINLNRSIKIISHFYFVYCSDNKK